MARETDIKIVDVTLPSGSLRWDVKGTVEGKRYRKRYSDPVEARKALDLLQALHEGVTTLPNRIQTSLTVSQVRDAEAAFQYLNEQFPGKTLAWLSNEFSRHYQPDLEYKILAEALIEYLDELRARGNTKKYVTNIESRLKHLRGWFPKKYVSEVEGKSLAKRIKELAEEEEFAPDTVKHYAAAHTGFFRWCEHADRCYFPRSRANPGSSIIVPKGGKAGKKREILTVEQARTVMTYAEIYNEGEMVNAAAIALFAGIRPDPEGEIVRLAEEVEFAPRPDDIIDIHNGVIRVSDYVGKTGSRNTDTQPALSAFLTRYPLEEYPIVKNGVESRESYFQRKWYKFKSALKKEHGLTIPHDALRHSFCSYLASQLGSAFDVADQAGNSEAILRRHYLRRVTREQADEFWAIRPQR